MRAKLKAHICSDLHLRHWNALFDLPGGEVLFLAGDVFDSATKRCFDDKRVQHFIKELAKYEIVYYVPGNHENYGLNISDAYTLLEDNLPKNVRIFENDWAKLEDYHIFGSTMWTDMNKRDPTTMTESARFMPDFSCIRNLDDTLFTPLNSTELHVEALKALTAGLEGKEKVIVMTHHCPSYRSVPARFLAPPHNLMNGAFTSDLDPFISRHPEIKMWIHGHTHDRFDYEIGECRVICNPKGYPTESNAFSMVEIEL